MAKVQLYTKSGILVSSHLDQSNVKLRALESAINDLLSKGDRGPYQLKPSGETLDMALLPGVFKARQASAPSDTLAPTTPAGLSVVGGGNQLVCSVDPAGDMPDVANGASASGVASYTFNVSGVDQTPIVATASNVQVAPALYAIGGSSNASYVPDGNTATLTSNGTGIDGTSDQISFVGVQVSGDFDAYVKVHSFSGAAQAYAPAGLMWREATAANVLANPGSRFGAIYNWEGAGNIGEDCKRRGVANAAFDFARNANGNGATGWKHIRRRGNVWTYRYSADNGAYTTLYSETLAVDAIVMVGVFVSDLQSSPQTATAVFKEFRVTQSAAITGTYASSSTSALPVKVKATDAAGNTSAYTATVSAVPASGGGGGGGHQYKWNPGHYLATTELSILGDTTRRAARRSLMDYLNGNALFKGFQCIYPWGSIETAQGVYNWSEVDADLAYVKAMGKKLIIMFWWQKYGVTELASDTRYFPQYIYDGGGVFHIPAGANAVQMDSPTWAARYIALVQAAAARYDNEPDVEMFLISETSTTGGSQYTSICNAVGAAWQHTASALLCNFFVNFNPPGTIGPMLAAAKVGFGAPDMIGPPGFNYQDQGSRVLQGLGQSYLYSPGDQQVDYGGVDYRGKLPVCYSYEMLNNVKVADIFDYQQNTLKCTHPCWTVGSWIEGTKWEDILAKVTEVGGVPGSTAYPSLLP